MCHSRPQAHGASILRIWAIDSEHSSLSFPQLHDTETLCCDFMFQNMKSRRRARVAGIPRLAAATSFSKTRADHPTCFTCFRRTGVSMRMARRGLFFDRGCLKLTVPLYTQLAWRAAANTATRATHRSLKKKTFPLSLQKATGRTGPGSGWLSDRPRQAVKPAQDRSRMHSELSEGVLKSMDSDFGANMAPTWSPFPPSMPPLGGSMQVAISMDAWLFHVSQLRWLKSYFCQ